MTKIPHKYIGRAKKIVDALDFNCKISFLILQLSFLLAFVFISIFFDSSEASISFQRASENISDYGCRSLHKPILDRPIKLNECLTKLDSRTFPDEDPELKHQWLFKYLDEQTREFRIQYLEDTIDERITNLAYLKKVVSWFNTDTKKINTGDKELDKEFARQAAGARVDDELCGQHLRVMVGTAKELEIIIEAKRRNYDKTLPELEEKHFRIARALESFGRYESGVMTGKVHFVGTYLQCEGTQMMLDEKVPTNKVGGRHCHAIVKLDKYLVPNLLNRTGHPYEVPLQLTVGVCLPETCHTKSFLENKQAIQTLLNNQFKLPSTLYLEENLEIDSLECGVDNDSEMAKLTLSAKLLIIFAILWSAIIIFATYRKNVKKTSDKLNGELVYVLDMFSLQRSWKDLVQERVEKESDRIHLNPLNAIKVLSSLFVLLEHSFFAEVFVGDNIVKSVFTIDTDPWVFFTVGANYLVDTLFVISAILMTYTELRKYNRLKEQSKTGSNGSSESIFVQWFKLALSRYFRLVPLFFLMIWFKRSTFRHLNNGPLWDHGMNKLTLHGACLNESWLVPFTWFGCYRPIGAQCLGQAWSVGNDIFFAIFLTPIVVLFTRRPKMAVYASFIVISLSSAVWFADWYNLPPSVLERFKGFRLDSMSLMFYEYTYLYTSPEFHVVSFIAGVLAGYCLYEYNKSPQKKWPRWFTSFSNFAGLSLACPMAAVICLPLFRNSSFLEKYPIHAPLLPGALTVGKILFAIANAVIIMRLTTDWKDTFLIRIFSGRVWQVLSKLNYLLLLLQVDILFFERSSRMNFLSYTRVGLYATIAFCYAYCMFFGCILYLMFENPISLIVKYLIFGHQKTQVIKPESILNADQKKKNDKNFPDYQGTFMSMTKLPS